MAQAKVIAVNNGRVVVRVRRNSKAEELYGSHYGLKVNDKIEVKRVANNPYLVRVHPTVEHTVSTNKHMIGEKVKIQSMADNSLQYGRVRKETNNYIEVTVQGHEGTIVFLFNKQTHYSTYSDYMYFSL
jgi:hypothetical protein